MVCGYPKSRLRVFVLGFCVLPLISGLAAAQTGSRVTQPAASLTQSPGRTPLLTQSAILNPPHQATHYALQVGERMSFPIYDKDYLIQFQRVNVNQSLPNLFVYGADGTLDRQATLWFEGSSKITIGTAAVTPSGEIVAAVSAVRDRGQFTRYLVKLSPNGRVAGTLNTGDYLPTGICVTDAGDIWTIGSSLRELKDPSAPVLRNWSFEAGELRGLLPRSSFQQGFYNAWRDASQTYLKCNAQTVGIYSAANSEWVEVTLKDLSVKRWNVDATANSPQRMTGFALYADGRVYGSFVSVNPEGLRGAAFQALSPDLKRAQQRGLQRGLQELTFDSLKGRAMWVPVQGTVSSGAHIGDFWQLLGSSDDSLVYFQRKRATGFNASWSRLSR
jgi:hypothetical protein